MLGVAVTSPICLLRRAPGVSAAGPGSQETGAIPGAEATAGGGAGGEAPWGLEIRLLFHRSSHMPGYIMSLISHCVVLNLALVRVL